MQAENWKKIKHLLDEVLQIETSERQNYLENADVSGEVRAEVESLLAFEGESEDLMHLSAVEFSKDFFDGDENALIGQQIGIYKIIGELGHGGMGAVYLAERADGKFEQKVALKLLKREMNTSALRRRFQQEREILARLEHPNIARLLDAGTTDDRVPFLAMEYVEGLPIDDYCNIHNLNLNSRLDLFRKVCSAVNFAHRNLIVHRDLKPSNILVNVDGNPKLLDFGISKILSSELEQLNSATVTKLGVMTPGYASPEQLRNESVTTATDIYSLGVILYELLSGHRPFESKENDFKEIYKAVLETEPMPPSVMISDFGFGIADLESQPESSPNRTKNQRIQTNPQSAIPNPKSLSGDLDNIVLKSLRKEPERRYLSAENFAEDIHRHQRGLPVTARPNTFSYRAEKFFKRNQPGVIAGVLLLVAIIGGIVATFWQSKVAAAERDRARIEAQKARKVNEYMQNILNFSNPLWISSNPKRNREAKIADAMDEALKNIDTDLADEPEIQAEILLTLGQTYTGQGQYEKAQKMLQQSLEKFDRVFGAGNTKSMKALSGLGSVYYITGKYDECEKSYTETINNFRPKVAADKSLNRWLAVSLNDLGNVHNYNSRYAEAEELYRESLQYAANLTGKERAMLPIVLGNLAWSLNAQGKFDEALKYYSQAQEEIVSMGNGERLEAGTLFNKIGVAYNEMGNYPKADEYYQKSYEILQKTVGEENFYTVSVMYRTAYNYYKQDKFAESETLINKSLEIQRKLFPNGHNLTAYSERLQGEIYTKKGDLQKGEEFLRKALDYLLKKTKEPNRDISLAKLSLGESLIAQKKYVEAKTIINSALEGSIKNVGENHLFTKQCREILSKIPE